MPAEVSIITPVYNSGGLLRELYDSLNEQSFTQFEWIIINDGSTDQETLSILDRLDKKSSNHSIIHTSNEGAPAARNKGIYRAEGKYIKFIDADDLIPANHLESQITSLRVHGVINAIVVSPFKILTHKQGHREITYSKELDKEYFIDPLLNSLYEFSFHHSGCLYHTEFVHKKLKWDESLEAHQDLDFLWQAMLAGAEFHVDNNTYFINREHDITERITTNKSPEKWTSRFKAVENIYSKLGDLNYEKKYVRNAIRRLDKIVVGAYNEFPETGLKLLNAKKRLTGDGLGLYLIIRFIKSKIKSYLS